MGLAHRGSVFQEPTSEQAEHACYLINEVEVPLGTMSCFRVEVCRYPERDSRIHIQGDTVRKKEENNAKVLIKNRTDQPQTLPAGLVLVRWEPMPGEEQLVQL